MSKKTKVYVAGHRGLLGSAVVRQLARRADMELIIRSRDELDLLDQAATRQFMVAEKPDQVYLCAARVGGIQANINEPGDFLYQNLQIQNNLIESARLSGVGKLLFVGSSCIYPREAENPISESALLTGPLEPTNEGYAIAKIAGLRLCEFYRRQYGCNFISAIPCNLYGINDHYSATKSHLVPALIMKIHDAKRNQAASVNLWGSGRPRREFMLADDCAEALVFLMEHYNEPEIVNIGMGDDLSVLEIAEAVGRALDWTGTFDLDPSKPDGMMRKLIDTSRLHAMGWKARHDLEAGVRIAYQDFLARGCGH